VVNKYKLLNSLERSRSDLTEVLLRHLPGEKLRKVSIVSTGIRPKIDWISQTLTSAYPYRVFGVNVSICLNCRLDHDAEDASYDYGRNKVPVENHSRNPQLPVTFITNVWLYMRDFVKIR
jgi:hypothetical protein